MSEMPFLNSVMLLPSERATLGSLLPNNSTAMAPTIINSIGFKPNMAKSCKKLLRCGSCFSGGPRSGDLSLAVGGVLLEFRDALLELSHTLTERTGHAGQLVAEQQHGDGAHDHQFHRIQAEHGEILQKLLSCGSYLLAGQGQAI